MGNKRNRNLHIVRDPDKDKLLRPGGEAAAEQAAADMQEQAEQSKKRMRKKILMIAGAAVLLATAVFLVIHLQTYTAVRVESTYKIDGAADGSYTEFAKGILI